MGNEIGHLTIVLHSHLPYVRYAGRWPHGEEMVHEAIAETYIPLLNALNDLRNEGLCPSLTIGLTPILLEQLADPLVIDNFNLYLQERLEGAEQAVVHEWDPARKHLAEFYLEFFQNLKVDFNERYNRDLVAAFRDLQEAGCLDIIVSAATHAYLPLLARDSSVYAQLVTGISTYRERFGRAPKGIWLPECGYRPGYITETDPSYYKLGIEEFLASLNLRYFFTDTHVIEGAGRDEVRTRGHWQEVVVGRERMADAGSGGVRSQLRTERRWIEGQVIANELTTLRPYFVRGSKVAVLGRNDRTSHQVWSAADGYPGDFAYREFHRKDDRSGLQMWRITGEDIDLGAKDLYEPSVAAARVQVHAEHFIGLVREELRSHAQNNEVPGVVVSAYDTELFGHWWFEGVHWLKEVLRQVALLDDISLTSADEYLDAHPAEDSLDIPESSWGSGGTDWTWRNERTEWMWQAIHAAELRMERLVKLYPNAYGEVERMLRQAARELMLLQASDWSFLVTTAQADDYACMRFNRHVERFNRLALAAESVDLSGRSLRYLAMTEETDNPFRQIDYHLFANREGVS